jgi:SOS-response transcriptional repressor LexA
MLPIGPAIKKLREKPGRAWSQTKLAALAGTTAPTISRIESGIFYPTQEMLARILSAMGMSLPKFYAELSTSNVEHAEIGGRVIPVIDYVQAGKWASVDARPVDIGDRETVVTDLEHPPSTFAMRIRGDSMEPKFEAGDLVIINPMLTPGPGDFVVAVEGSGEATFKQYRSVGKNGRGLDVFELIPLNTLYGPMRSDRHKIAIVGVMVEHRQYRPNRRR